MAKSTKHKFQFEFLFLRLKQSKSSENPIFRPDFVLDTLRQYEKALATANAGASPGASLDSSMLKLISATVGNTPKALDTVKSELRECAAALESLLAGKFTNEKDVRRRAEEFVDAFLFLPPGQDRNFIDDVIIRVRTVNNETTS